MSSFNKTIVVNSDLEKLWHILSDIRKMADLYTFMHIYDYKQEKDFLYYTRKLDIPGLATLCWQEVSQITDHTVNFNANGGDLAEFTGNWKAVNENDITLLSLNIEYEIPSGIGPNVPKFMAEAVLGQIFQKIMETIKTTAENKE
ncbi:MAG: hypothetical protein WCO98_10040 [bacterium]